MVDNWVVVVSKWIVVSYNLAPPGKSNHGAAPRTQCAAKRASGVRRDLAKIYID